MERYGSLVSVAMATYNGAAYLAEQLETILSQTYKNLELIITDDCSADQTISLLKDWQQRDSRIKLFFNEANQGVTKTFEHSFQHCRGEFIAIADQDDIWELDKIALLINEIGDADAVYSDSALVDKEGRSMNKTFKSMMNLQSYYSGAPFLMGNCVPGHTILMRADFVRKISPFPAEIMFDRWISFCAAASNGIRFLDRALVKYRQHDTNTVGTGKTKNKKNRKTSAQKFTIKLSELKAMENAPVKDEATKKLLRQMILLFHKKPSAKRSLFFFKNINNLLVIKNKPAYRKILYSLKMFFKPNY
ncbi:MAG: hypothetical protein JWQ27_1474 [Ferruginibacter sp.]|nr:hypothetical protein [Ferruginibacter sp.]